MVNPGCLQIDKDKVAALCNAQTTENKAKQRLFLCLCDVYRRFIDDFTGLVHLLKNS